MKLPQEQITMIPEELVRKYSVKHIGSTNTTEVIHVLPGRKELKVWREAFRQGGEDMARETLVTLQCVSHDNVELAKILDMRPALEPMIYADLLEVLHMGVERVGKSAAPSAT